MKRGVGYCENTDCEDYAKGVFLLNHGDTFYCPRCRQLGKVEKERGFYTGNSDIFKEVRVEYNFDPINGVYRVIARVFPTLTLPDGQRWITWIYSNPFYVE